MPFSRVPVSVCKDTDSERCQSSAAGPRMGLRCRWRFTVNLDDLAGLRSHCVFLCRLLNRLAEQPLSNLDHLHGPTNEMTSFIYKYTHTRSRLGGRVYLLRTMHEERAKPYSCFRSLSNRRIKKPLFDFGETTNNKWCMLCQTTEVHTKK